MCYKGVKGNNATGRVQWVVVKGQGQEQVYSER